MPVHKQVEDIIGEQLHHGVDDIAIDGVVTPPNAGSRLLWEELVLLGTILVNSSSFLVQGTGLTYLKPHNGGDGRAHSPSDGMTDCLPVTTSALTLNPYHQGKLGDRKHSPTYHKSKASCNLADENRRINPLLASTLFSTPPTTAPVAAASRCP